MPALAYGLGPPARSAIFSGILSSLLLLLPVAAAIAPLARQSADACPVLLRHDPPASPSSRLLTPSLSAAAPSAKHVNESRASESLRIVGGRRTIPQLAAYLAYIRNKPDGCTGTIIASKAVLTTASCASGDAASMTVSISYVSHMGRKAIGVEKVIFHPSYNPNTAVDTTATDVALIILKDGIMASSKIMPLNNRPTLPLTRSAVRMIGYGTLGMNGREAIRNEGAFLHRVDLPTVDFMTCNGLYGNILSPNAHFCAGYLIRRGCGGCSGDIGAPLVQYLSDGTPVLTGIALKPWQCGEAGRPVIALQVQPFLEWIAENGVVAQQSGAAEQRDAGEETSGDEKKAVRIGPIIGGAVGCVIVVAVMIAGAYVCARRRKRRLDKEGCKVSQTDPSVWSHGAAASGGGPDLRPPPPPPPPPQPEFQQQQHQQQQQQMQQQQMQNQESQAAAGAGAGPPPSEPRPWQHLGAAQPPPVWNMAAEQAGNAEQTGSAYAPPMGAPAPWNQSPFGWDEGA